MKFWLKTGVILLALALELVLANIVGLRSAKPDIILIVVICMSFISGAEDGILAGFTGGLLKDIFSVHFLGINALVKTSIGYIVGLLRDKIFSQHIMLIVIISTFVFTIINDLIVYFLLNALYSDHNFVVIFKKFILNQAVINSLLSPLIFIGIKKAFNYFQKLN